MDSATIALRRIFASTAAALALSAAPAGAAAADVATAPHRDVAVVVDGSLQEWTGTPSLVLDREAQRLPLTASARWSGPADSSASIHLAWDDARLYVAGTIVDDALVVSPRRLWLGDAVEVFLRIPETGGPADYQWVLAPMAPEIRWTFEYFRGRRVLTDGGFHGVEVAAREVTGPDGSYRGCTFEAALPFSNFPGFVPGGGEEPGFNIALVDADGGPGQKSYLLWSGRTGPAGDPSALGRLRLDPGREAPAPPAGPERRGWAVPAAILGAALLVLVLVGLLQARIQRVMDTAPWRKGVLASALLALLAAVRAVPSTLADRRAAAAAARLADGADLVAALGEEAVAARVVVPGREAPGSSLLALLDGGTAEPVPEFRHVLLPARAREPRRTVHGDAPVRDARVGLAGYRQVFRFPDAPAVESLVLVLRYLAPPDDAPPPGSPVCRVVAVAADGTTASLDLRRGREVEDARPVDGTLAAPPGARIAWIDPPATQGGEPLRCDEVSWPLRAGFHLAALEAEQVDPRGEMVLIGATAIPPDGRPAIPLALGRTTADGIPTSTRNGGPVDERVVLSAAEPRASVALPADAEVVHVIYGCPAGFAPEQSGARAAAFAIALDDGSSVASVVLEFGVHVDAARSPGGDHPADFRGRLAFRWRTPDGGILHRDVVTLEVPREARGRVRSLEMDHGGGAATVVVDAVTASTAVPRPRPAGLRTLVEREQGYALAPAARERARGIAATHFRGGSAVASTLPEALRARVLGTERPMGDGDAGTAEATRTAGYERVLGGTRWLARQVAVPVPGGDDVVEVAVPAPDAADVALPVAAATALLAALLLLPAVGLALDLLGRLPYLRWKLVGAFALAAPAPLVLLTLVLVRHFEDQVDRGIEREVRGQAAAAARAIAWRRDEAQRLADALLRDDAVRAALEDPDAEARPARVDAAVREFQARAAATTGPTLRVALEEIRDAGDGVQRATYPLRDVPAPFLGIYEPTGDLAFLWSRVVASGVARRRTAAGQVRGVVETAIDDRFLESIRRAGGERAQVILYSADGYPSAGTVPPDLDRGPAAAAARRSIAADLLRDPGEPGLGETVIGGVPHAVAYDLVRTADLRTVALLATAVPRAPLVAATLGTRDLLLALGAAATVLAFLVGTVMTRRVAGPVARLADVAAAVGAGDLEARADASGRDEIAMLARAFNRMTRALRGRIGELSRLNEGMVEFAGLLDRGRIAERATEAFRATPFGGRGVLLLLHDRETAADLVEAGHVGDLSVPRGPVPPGGVLATAVQGGDPRVVALPPDGGATAPAGERTLLAGRTAAVVLPFSAGGGRTRGAVVLLPDERAAAQVPASLDFLAALARSVGVALENARLHRLAVEDPPTGLLLAAYFKRRVQEEVDRSQATGRPVSVAILGIEGLDAGGPGAGARRLRAAADRMRAASRGMHLLARVGPSTVAALLPETDRDAAAAVAGRLRAAAEDERDAPPGGRPVAFAASVSAPEDGASAEFLLLEAGRALERARRERTGGHGPAEPVLPPGVDPADADALGFRSARSLHLLDALLRIAASDVPVLVLGETGAGKEVVADFVHGRSRRAGGPLVKVNCAALPAPLLESELFGHERGAFTGAERRHVGRFEQAHGGTIFLDEIGEMAPALQVKLLRVLQDRRVERLGGTGPVDVDVRVIAATNRDLPDMVAAGTFREDLYYRLNVLSVVVPPLRARREDIPPLAARFLREALAAHGRGPTEFTPEALDSLFRHPFPGNVRQLRNMVERAVVTATGPRITPSDLAFGERAVVPGGRAGGAGPAPPTGTATAGAATTGAPRPDASAAGGAPAAAAPAVGERATALLALLRERGRLTNREWCERAGVSTRTGLRDFEELLAAGLAERVGRRRGAVYRPR